MGMVCGASSPSTLPVIHVMYYLLSTDITMYFGCCGGGMGLRMNGDGRWPMACHDDYFYYTHIPTRHWAVGFSSLVDRTSHEEEPWA